MKVWIFGFVTKYSKALELAEQKASEYSIPELRWILANQSRYVVVVMNYFPKVIPKTCRSCT